MKITKSLMFTALVASAFIGCKSVSNIPVPQGSNVAVVAIGKKAPLTQYQKENWGHLDLLRDSIPGMSVDKAYEFLSNKKGKTVVVAVVDSGTDLGHEDLVENAWVNPGEVAGNNKDDDNNGFVDDIYGWNFLGDIYKESYELHRILRDKDIVDEATYAKAKKEYDKQVADAEKKLARYNQMLQGVKFADKTIKEKLGKDTYTKEDLKSLDDSDAQVKNSKMIANQMYGFGLSSLQEAIDELSGLVKTQQEITSGDALKKNYRTILNNDENTMEVKVYGNNKTGASIKSESHGSHVSGIIGASRTNGKGMRGVANNVKIMAVRAVPDGDEYDKDVALGIKYAVDNGAKVINTSFGKAYSPNIKWVYDAIKYAADKDVLIVNAAGNSGENIDVDLTYPNDTPDNKNEVADNMLTIGAMSSSYSETLPASFSNYGKQNVDIFAPGVQIYSTTPENEYKFYNGTSMAAPSTAGVAALIRSYYPDLTAKQVKHIIMNSGTKINLEVIRPGSKSQENPKGVKVPFSELSKTGRVVNAYNALKMADAMVNGK